MAPKKPALLISTKIKALADKAFRTPSRLTTEETRELGASVLAHLQISMSIVKPKARNQAVKQTASTKEASTTKKSAEKMNTLKSKKAGVATSG